MANFFKKENKMQSSVIKPWHSKWQGGKKGSYDYPAQPGTVQFIDSNLVKAIKEPLLIASKGKWGQSGKRYLYDRKGEVYGVVLSSYSDRDIHDVAKNQIWQHSASSSKLESGMTVYVVPSEKILKENSTAVGVKFTLA